MKIALASDHAGFALKEKLREALVKEGHEVTDYGTHSTESCDYPDYVQPVAEDVTGHRADRGILVCSTGIGMSMAANRFPGIRAALVRTTDDARLTREHNDANVVTLGAKYLDEPQAMELIELFLKTGFTGGRHARRVDKLTQLEHHES